MDSIRKWFYRPKREDKSLLAQFFYADESLNGVACELDSFDGRQEPERCSSLVNQLRHCQDRVLSICNQIMDELIPGARANRDFRVKFPDDVMQENLAGQLWFGAECLAAGSSILNREAESSAMRPLAKALTKSLEIVRNLLREQALRGQTTLQDSPVGSAGGQFEPAAEKLVESLKIFDRLFADFELCYVGAMVPVKSTREYEQQELVCVLFSETLQRALERGLLAQQDVDNYEPALMFTIPRLAIVAGLLAPPGGPLCLDAGGAVDNISEMFRPFRTLLLKIRELLWTLNNRELYMLEKLLCSIEEPPPSSSVGQPQQSQQSQHDPDLDEFVSNFYTGYPNCKDFIADFYTVTRNNGSNMDEVANDAVLALDQKQDAAAASAVASSSSTQCTSQQAPDNKRHDSSGSSDFYSCDSVSAEIPAQYLLNQVSHESAGGTPVVESPMQVQHSLAEVDAKKLISEANKSLSNLLLEAADCQADISEQTDSGLCTMISSENTSLYDKSPEEKKSFPSGNEQKQEEEADNDNAAEEESADEVAQRQREEEQENTSYSCSNINSPKRRDSSKSDNSCVCRSRGGSKSAYLQPSPLDCSKASTLSSNTLHSSNEEEIVGIAYGSGQLAVCDANQPPSFQINYTENWENLNLNIEAAASTSRREFWNELKCQNCPSGSSHAAAKLPPSSSSRKRKEDKQRRRHHRRKYEAAAKETLALQQQHHHCDAVSKRRGTTGYRAGGVQLPATSTESSRSNSTDRCLNPRLVNFGASLHPSQNTRQMPNFGACSPHASPRMQHFEPRASSRRHHVAHHHNSATTAHSRKLLEHRRSRSEQLQRLKKRDSLKRKVDGGAALAALAAAAAGNRRTESELKNDGLGPRTNKSGVAGQSGSPTPSSPAPPPPDLRISKPDDGLSHGSSSSCSSCYDTSSETSEFQSDCQDDEEIALAMQAAEIANRNQIRAKFRSSEDLVHRLFVCIAGVADQLQTNFASDLRNILKCVFLMNSSQPTNDEEEAAAVAAAAAADSQSSPDSPVETSAHTEGNSHEALERQNSVEAESQPANEQQSVEERSSPVTERGEECVERAPVWVPDSVAPRCMACQAGFTVVRRRHHCRNCGQVFCGRCSSNSVPLPRYGHTKPVRVCNRCYIYQVTPFTVSSQLASTS